MKPSNDTYVDISEWCWYCDGNIDSNEHLYTIESIEVEDDKEENSSEITMQGARALTTTESI